MKKLCIYHGDCADGFGAAWVVRKALGDNVEFHKGVYGESPPDVTDRNVIMVDFSYKFEVLTLMINDAKSVTIIDHHKTAEADLKPLLGQGLIDGIFDMTKSGAMLAWEWFMPHEDVPDLIKYIQDRDLWKFDMKDTRPIYASLSSYQHDFRVWDDLFNTDLSILRNEGIAIDRKQSRDLNEFIGTTKHRVIIDGFNVPAVNVPYMWASDAGHIMAEGEPFAVCYFHKAERMVFSLRSTDEGVDVSEIAVRFGGGGHRNAAGFEMKIPEGNILNIQIGS